MKLNWRINPVLARESRVRMRGWKAPALISLYVGLLGAAALLILSTATIGRQGVFTPELGSIIYGVLVYAQFTLLVFAVPGLTAGAIAGEREKQTLDLLLVTRLSPFQVVTGKLGAAVAFTLLLMFASLPVYGLLFLLGGVSLYHLFLTVLVYLVTIFLLGSVGIYFSALFKRTQASVVAAYGTSFGLMLFTMVAGMMLMEVFSRPPDNPPAWGVIFAYTNPLMAISAAAGGPVGGLTTLFQRLLLTPAAREAIWWKYCLFGLATGALLIWRTTVRISPIKAKDWRSNL